MTRRPGAIRYDRIAILLIVLAIGVFLVVRGMSSNSSDSRRQAVAAVTSGETARPLPPVVRAAPDGLGPVHIKALQGHDQVVVVTAKTGSRADVSLWQRTTDGWDQVNRWAARSGENGWSRQPTYQSKLSPLGTFTLTAAGGNQPAPAGTKLPYDYHGHDDKSYYNNYASPGVDPFKAFSYVVAIDLNRPAGQSPRLDDPRTAGYWFHVTSEGLPSSGCITQTSEDMKVLLSWLNPTDHPITMIDWPQELKK